MILSKNYSNQSQKKLFDYVSVSLSLDFVDPINHNQL